MPTDPRHASAIAELEVLERLGQEHGIAHLVERCTRRLRALLAAPESGQPAVPVLLCSRCGYGSDKHWQGRCPKYGPKEGMFESSGDVFADIGATPPAESGQPADPWQPIATAPKDGTEILLRWNAGFMLSGHYSRFAGRTTWLTSRGEYDGVNAPKYWMPLLGAAASRPEPRVVPANDSDWRRLSAGFTEITNGEAPSVATQPDPPRCSHGEEDWEGNYWALVDALGLLSTSTFADTFEKARALRAAQARPPMPSGLVKRCHDTLLALLKFYDSEQPRKLDQALGWRDNENAIHAQASDLINELAAQARPVSEGEESQ